MDKKLASLRKTLVQNRLMTIILSVFAAFILLATLSSVAMYRILNEKLSTQVEQTANYIQALLSDRLSEAETILNFTADEIERMIDRGADSKAVQSYMAACSTDEFKAKMRVSSGYVSIFGFFDVFDSFLDGKPWALPANFAPKTRPWYTNVIESNRDVAITSLVYSERRFNHPVIFFSRSLYSADGKQFYGVVSISTPIEKLNEIITGAHFTKSSFSSILDKDLNIFMHPNSDAIGNSVFDYNPYLLPIEDLIRYGADISMQQIKSYRNKDSLLFCRKIYNGWSLLFIIPESEYYSPMYSLTIIIVALALVLATGLSILLLKVDSARNQADIRNRQKSNFLAVISHEIRTPMNAIMGIAEAQLHDSNDSSMPLTVREAFDRIYYSGSLLLRIIGDLLDFSKIESGKLEITPEKYEVASLINEVVHLNTLRYDSKPIEFKLFVDENIPATLIGDELRIKQILSNLLSNAFKYTWKGSVELHIKAKINEDRSYVNLIFSVRDTGQGIAREDIKLLFDEYARFNPDANRLTQGTGLGLSITKNLVDMMRGVISVESEIDKGSTFTVYLPQKISEASAVLSKAVVDNLCKFHFSSASHLKKTPILRKHMPYGTALVVDDVEMNLFVAKLLLRPYGIRVDTAASGYAAIDMIKDGNAYDVIFMDHMMPRMDGIEATKIIRDLGYSHPIVALTANAVSGQADVFLSNGFDDFISKPIDIRILDSTLNKYVHSKQPDEDDWQRPPEPIEDHHKGYTPFNLSSLSNNKGLGLDVGRGLDVFEGDIDDYVAALRSFVNNVPEIIGKLRNTTAQGLADYTINVHSLKSACAWICAEEMREGAAELEALSRAGDLDGVASKNDAFVNKIDDFLARLQTLLEDG